MAHSYSVHLVSTSPQSLPFGGQYQWLRRRPRFGSGGGLIMPRALRRDTTSLASATPSGSSGSTGFLQKIVLRASVCFSFRWTVGILWSSSFRA